MQNFCKVGVYIIAMLSVAVLSGCNTVQGFGQDLSAGGKALSSAADNVKGGSKKSNATAHSSAEVKSAAFQDDLHTSN